MQVCTISTQLLPVIGQCSYSAKETVMGLTFGLIVRWTTPVPPTWRGGIVAAGENCVSFQLMLALNFTKAFLEIGVIL